MPPSIASPFLTALLFISNIVLQAYSQDQNTPFVTYCYGGSFNSSTPYDTSLRSLIAGLVNSTPNSPSYFLLNNSTRSPVIFGLAQCRPDITPAACAACLNKTASAAADTPPAGCALKNSGSLRSLNCLLRYSDQNFYSSVESKMFVYENEVQNASTFFARQTQVLMNSVMGATAASSLRFGVDVANDTVDALDIYGMGWCSMDLASDDCAQCLKFIFGKIPAGKNKGIGGTVSCMMRFDNYQFYNNSILGMPSSPPATGGKSAKSKTIAIVAGASGAVALLLLFTFFILLLRRRNKKLTASKIRHAVEEEDLQSFEIQMIDFSTIRKATNKFANENKLGQGGFGPVYKGVLINGQEIAVKRLSATSGQGIQEMKNEIHFVAKLQHKNLVRLLGYCLEGDEKLLVYEFLPNTSLDKFLFHPVRRMQLDWDTRLRIIIGIARGLLYLHEDSVLRIVHRDLKASNILLDSNMNPKISDFGLAKLFNIDETERNTSRIAGTFGYMAPEYIFHGLFSTKSDVFSYGVLVLEIITGEKTSLGGSEEAVDLLSHVWKHWKEGKAEQLVDKSLGELHSAQEALRCVHIGLLCVQEEQIKRPSMALVNMMLSNSTVDLPSPSIPAFYTDQGKLGHADSAARSRGFEPPERRTKNAVESIIQHQDSQVV